MRYPIISMRELEYWILTGRRMYLIDLRGREAYEKGHLQGAVNIPFDELEERLGELPAGIPLVFYCVRGSQSISGRQRGRRPERLPGPSSGRGKMNAPPRNAAAG